MPVCCAYGCNNRSGVKKSPTQKELEQHKKVSFHAIPKDPVRRENWVKAINRVDWAPATNTVICSEHFLDEHFDRTSLSCVRLRENAIPTIFKICPFYLEKENRKRREAIRIIESLNVYKMDIAESNKIQNSDLLSSLQNDIDEMLIALSLNKLAPLNQLRLKKYNGFQKINLLQQYRTQQAKRIAYLSNVLRKLKYKKFIQDNDEIDFLN